jgi:hypothetical protein
VSRCSPGRAPRGAQLRYNPAVRRITVGLLGTAVAAVVLSTAFPRRTSASPTAPFAEAAPPSAPITAASVAQHYIDVGRKIRRFAQDRGAEAASKLWERFRYIRINDALIDPAKRDETDARLRRIEDSLTADCSR